MNILMLGRWLPPARRPVRDTREYQFGRYLARDHQLTVAFVTDNPDTSGALSALRKEFTDIECPSRDGFAHATRSTNPATTP